MEIRLIFLNRLNIVINCGGTQEAMYAGDWKSQFKRVGSDSRKIRCCVRN